MAEGLRYGDLVRFRDGMQPWPEAFDADAAEAQSAGMFVEAVEATSDPSMRMIHLRGHACLYEEAVLERVEAGRGLPLHTGPGFTPLPPEVSVWAGSQPQRVDPIRAEALDSLVRYTAVQTEAPPPPAAESPPRDRAGEWLAWIDRVRARLLRDEFGSEAPAEALGFFGCNWTQHYPCVLRAPPNEALDWDLGVLEERLGPDALLAVQVNRIGDPGRERDAESRRVRLPVAEVVTLIEEGRRDCVYLTARDHAHNPDLIAALAPDLDPLPPILRPDPTKGMLWIGNADTHTHHDRTCNLIIGHVGRKLFRLIPPSQVRKLSLISGVYASPLLPDQETLQAMGVAYQDVEIGPGDAVFVPCGWWHSCQSRGVSVTSTWTSFWWSNSGFDEGFPE